MAARQRRDVPSRDTVEESVLLTRIAQDMLTRTTPYQVPHLRTSAPCQLEEISNPTSDLTCIRPTYTMDILVESGFEPGTFQSESRDLNTRPPFKKLEPPQYIGVEVRFLLDVILDDPRSLQSTEDILLSVITSP
ncbi:hypothetical protein AVEN_51918-1 [Araneus ventricosus]|uniref:Uncharacterized protein n=1 Tax=Araneus ventricosus TaxID=182803 RepID=A0A4Y2WYL1_ARAVE|nr:hypothetical protein AVEN_192814-1 [Araneus ventricosus]GBO41610.1 hypothetical protein AVEN_51918-1 [Araneus ventricosus]